MLCTLRLYLPLFFYLPLISRSLSLPSFLCFSPSLYLLSFFLSLSLPLSISSLPLFLSLSLSLSLSPLFLSLSLLSHSLCLSLSLSLTLTLFELPPYFYSPSFFPFYYSHLLLFCYTSFALTVLTLYRTVRTGNELPFMP
jgi:hypothetical protein